MNIYEGEFRLLKLLELYTKDESKQGFKNLKDRILSELNRYEKLYLVEQLFINKEKGILDKQNLHDIETLHEKQYITENQYCYLLHLKNLTEQGYKQIEVATDNGFIYPSIQDRFENHILTLF